ncbi:MAG: DNA internalization-related competence protein ComEC/Rec2 [Selenomonadaceae bacterium]|nr:DNA internalization-related competence protein ComEC/Rec2 [Selenomonadaceae bacterium]
MKSLFRLGQHQLFFLNVLCLLLGAGIIIADICGLISLSLLAGLGGLSVFLLALSGVCAARESVFFFAPVTALFFLLGFLRYECALGEPDYSRLAGEQVKLAGVVEESPEVGVVNGKPRRRFVLRVTESSNLSAGGQLYVSEIMKQPDGEFSPLEIGDRVKVFGKLRAIRGYGNPGRIDTVRQAKSRGISGRVTAVTLTVSRSAEDELSGWMHLRRQMVRLREHYSRSLGETMPDRDRAAVMAMLFGGYGDLDPGLVESFTLTGIVHILSVSGSHMALLAGIVLWLGEMLRLKRRVIFAGLTGVVLLYSLLSGLIPPVVRSGLMAIAAFGAFVWGRGDSRDGGRLLVILAAALLIYEPRWLYDISFQLSFLATAGLIYIAPEVTALLTDRGLPRWLAMGLAVTFGANISTLPVIAWYFNQFSLSSFAANLLIVPLVDFIIAVTLLGGIAGLILPPLMKLTFVTAGLTMGAVRELSALLAGMPFGNIYLPTLSLPMTVGYYSLLCLLLWKKSRSFMAEGILQGLDWAGKYIQGRRLLPTALGIVLSIGGLLWAFSPERNITSVHFIDVGQGNAALVVTPRRQAFLIDTGGTIDSNFDIGARVVVPYLKHYGVQPEDLTHIFLTHAHADHAGGAGAVWRWQRSAGAVPARLITAGEGRDAYFSAMYLSGSEREAIDMTAPVPGTVYDIDGVKAEVMDTAVPVGNADGKSGRGNEYSMVLKVTAGDISFLFTGDLPAAGEERLLTKYGEGNKRTEALKASVLQVAHHGSHSSSGESFLRRVSPAAAVISAGFQNSFGHPHKTVLDRLTAQGCQILRTDLDGAVVFHTDGKRLTVETFY